MLKLFVTHLNSCLPCGLQWPPFSPLTPLSWRSCIRKMPAATWGYCLYHEMCRNPEMRREKKRKLAFNYLFFCRPVTVTVMSGRRTDGDYILPIKKMFDVTFYFSTATKGFEVKRSDRVLWFKLKFN